MLLAGCASSALDLAPAAPDRPWQPNVSASGEIVPGPPTSSEPTRQGYVLPADPTLASLPPAPSIDPAKTYDLADLIDLAESTNPETRIAWNSARNAALAAGIARGSYLPHLTATALGIYQTSSGRASALGISGRDDLSASGAISALSLQWLLFDFGERDALVESADQTTIVANIEFTAAHQRLIHAVSLAFYNHAAARARADIATQSLRDAQEIEKAAEQRFKNGVGTVIEVAQAKQATALANLGLVQTRGATQDAYVTLLSAMGLPPLLKIRIADVSRHPLVYECGSTLVLNGEAGRGPDVLSSCRAGQARAWLRRCHCCRRVGGGGSRRRCCGCGQAQRAENGCQQHSSRSACDRMNVTGCSFLIRGGLCNFSLLRCAATVTGHSD